MGKDLPDGSKLSIIQGMWGTEYKNLRVTEDGELYILVSALSGVTLIPLQADADGNLFLNIKAQDLAEIINRPKYGGARRVSNYIDDAPIGYNTLFTISGKGIVYGGFLRISGASACHLDEIIFEVDGTTFAYTSMYSLLVGRLVLPSSYSLYLTKYDSSIYSYFASFSPNITFETSLRLRVLVGSTDPFLDCDFNYALV